MVPPVTGSVPATRLKSVVLPAPLGPISARRSPGATVRLTPSTARRPPKCLATPSSRRTSSAIALFARPAAQGAHHAARREQDDADVHRAEDEQPALGVKAHEVLEEHDDARA